MKTRLVFGFTLLSFLLPTLIGAEENGFEDDPVAQSIVMPGDAVDLESLIWVKRPVIVFADSPNDPRFIQQMEFIEERLADLEERDVIVLTD
ncbi:MAG: DUF4174 domain-containing protein, partial [Pseudomonadota bacterium]